jgi:hypothetical protein
MVVQGKHTFSIFVNAFFFAQIRAIFGSSISAKHGYNNNNNNNNNYYYYYYYYYYYCYSSSSITISAVLVVAP